MIKTGITPLLGYNKLIQQKNWCHVGNSVNR